MRTVRTVQTERRLGRGRTPARRLGGVRTPGRRLGRGRTPGRRLGRGRTPEHRLGHGRTPGRLLTAAIAVAVVLGVVGCVRPRPTTLPPGAQPPGTRPPGMSAAFDATDRAWIEITIAMDEQVRPLLDLVPERYADRTVPALAGQVRAIVDTELPALRLLHDRAGLPAQNPHAGMLMPGLVTADQVARATALRGEEFDAFAVATLREYLAHGADLARSETKNGQEPRTEALATTAIGTRTRALSAGPPAP